MDLNPCDDGLVVIEHACQAVIGGCGSEVNNSILSGAHHPEPPSPIYP